MKDPAFNYPELMTSILKLEGRAYSKCVKPLRFEN
jgi:hypothetical protein